jgi:TP901 family phage tail tape measure protein
MATGVTRNVNVVVSVVDQFGSGLTNFSSGWATAGKAILAAEAAMIAASLAAAKLATEIGTNVFDSATDFHDAIYDVTAVAQSFGTTSEDISGILNDLVIKFPLTGAAAGEAMQLIAQMGYGGKEELEGMADAAVTLQIATGTDLMTAAKGTMATMNAFGMEIGETDRVINLFAAAAFNSAASVDAIKDAMKYAAPQAALTGQSIEGTVAAVSKLVDKGLEASQAGTVLRMSLANLLKETDKGTAALAKYGLTYEDVNPEVHSLSEIIAAFRGQTVQASDAVDIFGVRQLAFATLINDGASAFDSYTESITGTNAAYDAMEQKMKTWRVVQNMVIGDLDVLKATIGEDLVEAVVDFVGKDENSGIRGIITTLRELEENKGFIGGEMLETFLKLKDIGAEVFSDAFGDAEGFYNWLADIVDMLGANLEILAAWGGELVEVFVSGTTGVEGMQTALTVFNLTTAAISLTVAAIHDAFALMFNGVQGAIDIAQAAFYTFGEKAAEAVKWIAEALNTLPFVDLDDAIADLEGKITEWGKKAAETFEEDSYMTMWSDNVIDAAVKAQEGINTLGQHASAAAENVKEIEEASRDLGAAFDDPLAALKEMKDLSSAETDLLISMAIEAGATAGEIYEATGRFVEINEQTKEWADKYAGVKADVEATTEESKELADAQARVAEEGIKAALSLEDLAKHELKLETMQFEHDLDMMKLWAEQTHEVVMANIEWSAKLDIAQVEANAKVMVAAFESIGESVQAAADAAASMFSSLMDFEGSMSDKWMYQDILKDQMEIQRDLADSQIDLTDAQADLVREQTDALRSGEKVPIEVSIQGDVEGWLSGLIQSMFEEIMLKAEVEAFHVFGNVGQIPEQTT